MQLLSIWSKAIPYIKIHICNILACTVANKGITNKST